MPATKPVRFPSASSEPPSTRKSRRPLTCIKAPQRRNGYSRNVISTGHRPPPPAPHARPTVAAARAPQHSQRLRNAARTRGLLLLLGWFFATGTQWDVLQITAWAGMWTRHLQTETVFQATAATFSGDEVCRICDLVQSGRDADSAAVTGVQEKSPLLLPDSPRVILSAPASSPRRAGPVWRCPPAPVFPPSARPPRTAAA
jgi:hypothetical protein